MQCLGSTPSKEEEDFKDLIEMFSQGNITTKAPWTDALLREPQQSRLCSQGAECQFRTQASFENQKKSFVFHIESCDKCMALCIKHADGNSCKEFCCYCSECHGPVVTARPPILCSPLFNFYMNLLNHIDPIKCLLLLLLERTRVAFANCSN